MDNLFVETVRVETLHSRNVALLQFSKPPIVGATFLRATSRVRCGTGVRNCGRSVFVETLHSRNVAFYQFSKPPIVGATFLRATSRVQCGTGVRDCGRSVFVETLHSRNVALYQFSKPQVVGATFLRATSRVRCGTGVWDCGRSVFVETLHSRNVALCQIFETADRVRNVSTGNVSRSVRHGRLGFGKTGIVITERWAVCDHHFETSDGFDYARRCRRNVEIEFCARCRNLHATFLHATSLQMHGSYDSIIHPIFHPGLSAHRHSVGIELQALAGFADPADDLCGAAHY